MLGSVKNPPERLIVKGAIVKQPEAYYIRGYNCYKIHESLPSGRIMAVTYKHCRELPAKDGSIIYDPYDIDQVLIDFGWMGNIVVDPKSLVIQEDQMVCLTHAERITP